MKLLGNELKMKITIKKLTVSIKQMPDLNITNYIPIKMELERACLNPN